MRGVRIKYHLGTLARLILAILFVSTAQMVLISIGDIDPDNGVLATIAGSGVLLSYAGFIAYVVVNVIFERIIDPFTHED